MPGLGRSADPGKQRNDGPFATLEPHARRGAGFEKAQVDRHRYTNYTGLIVSGIVTRFFTQPDQRESVRTIRWHEIGKLPADPTLDDVRPYLHTRNNLIELNEIHHAMQILGDGNGIYIRGAGPGNVIRRNYIHHLVAETNAQGAIRTDGGQMDTLIAENLIYKCKSQGMTLKLNNRFENNIIADVIAPRGTYLKIVEGPMTGASNQAEHILFIVGRLHLHL